MEPLANTTVPTTTTFLALTKLITLPITLLRTARNAIASVIPVTFSFVQTAHVKLKADSMAMVIFCITKQVWAYVEGWRDRGRRGKKYGEVTAEDKKKRKKIAKKAQVMKGKRAARVVVRGKYILILK